MQYDCIKKYINGPVWVYLWAYMSTFMGLYEYIFGYLWGYTCECIYEYTYGVHLWVFMGICTFCTMYLWIHYDNDIKLVLKKVLAMLF